MSFSAKVFRGSEDENRDLERFCADHLDDFWPYSEFILSLKIPQTFLLFLNEGSNWKALALGRVISGTAELFFIFVHPSWRRQGLAGLMLRDFELYSEKSFQAESVYLEVRRSNLGAIGLYESAGYMKIAERKRYYKDGEDAMIYEKRGPKG